MRPARFLTLICVFVCAAFVVAAPALADDDEPWHANINHSTLTRGLSNMALAPVDLLLSPLATTIGIFRNMQDISDSTGVRIAYPIPAWGFVEGTNIGCSIIRFVSGTLEVIPGIFLLFTEDTKVDTLFDPTEDARALFEIEPETWDATLRFGINYTVSDQ